MKTAPICIALAALAVTAACSSTPDPEQQINTTTPGGDPSLTHPFPLPGTVDVRHPGVDASTTGDASATDSATNDQDAPSNICCGGVLCGSVCRDLNHDNANCGSCGNACNPDQVCTGGTCTTCNTVCGGKCADLAHDYGNCGQCGNACLNGDVCDNGTCVKCPTKVCNGSCVDLTADNVNCGSCGTKCQASEKCTSGKCTPCAHTCNGVCTDLDNDPANCGACGNACASGDSCKSGSCVCM